MIHRRGYNRCEQLTLLYCVRLACYQSTPLRIGLHLSAPKQALSAISFFTQGMREISRAGVWRAAIGSAPCLTSVLYVPNDSGSTFFGQACAERQIAASRHCHAGVKRVKTGGKKGALECRDGLYSARPSLYHHPPPFLPVWRKKKPATGI